MVYPKGYEMTMMVSSRSTCKVFLQAETCIRLFCKKNEIEMIKSRSLNPKSQGKFERSDRALHSKIYYDMMQNKKQE